MQDKGYVQTLSTVLPTNLQKLSKQYLQEFRQSTEFCKLVPHIMQSNNETQRIKGVTYMCLRVSFVTWRWV